MVDYIKIKDEVLKRISDDLSRVDTINFNNLVKYTCAFDTSRNKEFGINKFIKGRHCDELCDTCCWRKTEILESDGIRYIEDKDGYLIDIEVNTPEIETNFSHFDVDGVKLFDAMSFNESHIVIIKEDVDYPKNVMLHIYKYNDFVILTEIPFIHYKRENLSTMDIHHGCMFIDYNDDHRIIIWYNNDNIDDVEFVC